MNKQVFLILIALTLNGCAVIKWKHPTKGYGNISAMSNPKGSNEFIREYKDCGKIADRQVKTEKENKKKARLAKGKKKSNNFANEVFPAPILPSIAM